MKDGYLGLQTKAKTSRRQWISIPPEVKEMVVEIALDKEDLSCRELAHYITDEQQMFNSESSVYRILKKRELTTAPSHILL